MKHATGLIATGGRRRALGARGYIVLCLMGLLLPLGTAEGRSESYVVRVTETGFTDEHSLTLLCANPENQLCQGDIALSKWAQIRSVHVTFLFSGSDVFLKFGNAEAQFFADGWPLVRASLDDRGALDRNVTLMEPMPLVKDDSFGLYHRPVLRGTEKILARLTIEIRPSP